MNEPNEPNVQPEDNPQPQGEGEPEYFDVVADDDDVMPALEVPPVGDPEDSSFEEPDKLFTKDDGFLMQAKK